MSRYLIIFGNVVDGMGFVGPFETRVDAVEHAGRVMGSGDTDWWVAPLEAPISRLPIPDKVIDLEVSVRLKNILLKAGLDTTHAVALTPKNVLKKLPGMGARTFRELSEVFYE